MFRQKNKSSKEDGDRYTHTATSSLLEFFHAKENRNSNALIAYDLFWSRPIGSPTYVRRLSILPVVMNDPTTRGARPVRAVAPIWGDRLARFEIHRKRTMDESRTHDSVQYSIFDTSKETIESCSCLEIEGDLSVLLLISGEYSASWPRSTERAPWDHQYQRLLLSQVTEVRIRSTDISSTHLHQFLQSRLPHITRLTLAKLRREFFPWLYELTALQSLTVWDVESDCLHEFYDYLYWKRNSIVALDVQYPPMEQGVIRSLFYQNRVIQCLFIKPAVTPCSDTTCNTENSDEFLQVLVGANRWCAQNQYLQRSPRITRDAMEVFRHWWYLIHQQEPLLRDAQALKSREALNCAERADPLCSLRD